MEEHKAQREPIEIPEHLRQAEQAVEHRRFPLPQHGRGFGKTARLRGALRRSPLLDELPGLPGTPEPTQRTRRDTGPFCRATAGHVVWRGVPSRFQVREPSKLAQAFHRTKSPPWKRKAQARRKAKLQKASRRVNRD